MKSSTIFCKAAGSMTPYALSSAKAAADRPRNSPMHSSREKILLYILSFFIRCAPKIQKCKSQYNT